MQTPDAQNKASYQPAPARWKGSGIVANVRFGSKADVALLNFDVRFTPKSGRWN
jgi:hypothetical protein